MLERILTNRNLTPEEAPKSVEKHSKRIWGHLQDILQAQKDWKPKDKTNRALVTSMSTSWLACSSTQAQQTQDIITATSKREIESLKTMANGSSSMTLLSRNSAFQIWRRNALEVSSKSTTIMSSTTKATKMRTDCMSDAAMHTWYSMRGSTKVEISKV